MKLFSLIFIILTSIFQNTAELKGIDNNNQVACFNKSQNLKILLASYQNPESDQQSTSSIGFLFNDISNHSINFVEFKEYEELCHNSVQFRKGLLVTSKNNIFSPNYKTLHSFFSSYSKNYNASSAVSKQVLYQVFII